MDKLCLIWRWLLSDRFGAGMIRPQNLNVFTLKIKKEESEDV